MRALRVGYTGESDPPGVVFTADLFDADTLPVVAGTSIPVNVGSPEMLRQLGAALAARHHAAASTPASATATRKTNTGGELSQARHLAHRACTSASAGPTLGLDLNGLHMHIGSGTDFDHLATVCDAMVESGRRDGAAA